MYPNIHAFYLVLFFIFLILPSQALWAEISTANQSPLYSISTQPGDLFQTLDAISRLTKVTISITHHANQKIKAKTYTDQTLFSIMADLFRGRNKAFVWLFESGAVAEVRIYIPPKTMHNKSKMVDFSPDQSEAALTQNTVHGQNQPSAHRALQQKVGSPPQIVSKRNEVVHAKKVQDPGFQSEKKSTGTRASRSLFASTSGPNAGSENSSSDAPKQKQKDSGSGQSTPPKQPSTPTSGLGLEPPPMPPGM